MNYYILKQEDRMEGQAFVMDCPESIDPLDLIDGKIISEPNKLPLQLKLSPGSGDFRGDIISGLVTLFHKDLIDELLKLKTTNFQHFPVELTEPDGEVEPGYFLINIIGLMEAVDVENSIIEESSVSGARGWLQSFKIDPLKARGQRLFRIVEAPNLIIIDQILRDCLDKYEPPGVRMMPTEKYNGWSV